MQINGAMVGLRTALALARGITDRKRTCTWHGRKLLVSYNLRASTFGQLANGPHAHCRREHAVPTAKYIREASAVTRLTNTQCRWRLTFPAVIKTSRELSNAKPRRLAVHM